MAVTSNINRIYLIKKLKKKKTEGLHIERKKKTNNPINRQFSISEITIAVKKSEVKHQPRTRQNII